MTSHCAQPVPPGAARDYRIGFPVKTSPVVAGKSHERRATGIPLHVQVRRLLPRSMQDPTQERGEAVRRRRAGHGGQNRRSGDRQREGDGSYPHDSGEALRVSDAQKADPHVARGQVRRRHLRGQAVRRGNPDVERVRRGGRVLHDRTPLLQRLSARCAIPSNDDQNDPIRWRSVQGSRRFDRAQRFVPPLVEDPAVRDGRRARRFDRPEKAAQGHILLGHDGNPANDDHCRDALHGVVDPVATFLVDHRLSPLESRASLDLAELISANVTSLRRRKLWESGPLPLRDRVTT